MTTRHTVTDNRAAVTTDCGPGMVGLYHEKYQTGSNDPIHRHAINPYHMTDELIIDELLEWTYPGTPGVYHSGTFISCFGGIVVAIPDFDSNDLNRLVNKLGEKIKQHDFNAAVSVGAEGKEALEQVAVATGRLYRGMRELIGNRNKADGILRPTNWSLVGREFGINPKQINKRGIDKDLAGKVLATQLGWIPLMSDIKSGFDAYHALSVKPKSQTYHAHVKKLGTATIYGVECGEAYRSRKITWTMSESLSWAESLSLTNPWDFLDLAWNATRLSFIADWFIPVGSYLSARSLSSTLTGSGFYTDYVHSKGASPQKFSVYTLKSGGTFKFQRTSVDRVLLPSLSGLVSLPSWKDPSKVPSLKRALTAVTLATQMFR